MGLTFASLTEVSRAPRSVALDRSLLEGPPDLLTTLSPSRVRVPNYSTNNKREHECSLLLLAEGMGPFRLRLRLAFS